MSDRSIEAISRRVGVVGLKQLGDLVELGGNRCGDASVQPHAGGRLGLRGSWLAVGSVRVACRQVFLPSRRARVGMARQRVISAK